MAFALSAGRGLRRYDEHAAATNKLTDAFSGLASDLSPSNVLANLKRAAPYMAIPLRIVSLVDLLFAWTKPQDWRGGRLPVVWPSNDLLAQKLGVSVRQVQKLLKQAQVEGLVAFADSPNGHRGGRRGADGQIVWGYGIVLAPLGARIDEFADRAAAGAAEDAAIVVLRKRLAAARRSIRGLAQALAEAGIANREAEEAVVLAQMATAQMRNVRDNALLTACVDQIEAQAKGLEAAFCGMAASLGEVPITANNSCSDAPEFAHSTTTNEPQSASADTSIGLANKSRKTAVMDQGGALTAVEADLEKYGVGPNLMVEIAPELCSSLPFRDGSWGEVVATAERLAGQSGISRHAFHEACRVMGQRGAAVSVIATLQKYRSGEVHRPGAYLRGMSRKASLGELNLGRSLHGLKETSRLKAMRGLSDGTEAAPVGTLVTRLLGQARARS